MQNILLFLFISFRLHTNIPQSFQFPFLLPFNVETDCIIFSAMSTCYFPSIILLENILFILLSVLFFSHKAYIIFLVCILILFRMRSLNYLFIQVRIEPFLVVQFVHKEEREVMWNSFFKHSSTHYVLTKHKVKQPVGINFRTII